MRCFSCDCILTDEEATTKSPTTEEYLDLCKDCFKDIKEAFIEEEEKDE